MAISLESISKEKMMRAPRIIVLGTEKVGKSTFASDSEEPIFIPIKREEGIDEIEVPKFPVAENFGDVIQCLGVLCNEDHPYKTVVIDSASSLEPLIWDECCKRNNAESIEKVGGGYAKGYTESLKEWRDIIDGLDWLRSEKNMASILIGHVTVKAFNDPTTDSYDQYRFDINQKAADVLLRWSDSVLFLNQRVYTSKEDAGFGKTKVKATGEARRFVYTQKRPAHPGGGRGVFGRLPYEIPLSWAEYQKAVAVVNGSE